MDRFGRIAAAVVVMIVGSVVAGAPSSAGETAKVTGEWHLTVETPNGSGTPSVVIKQDGETLTGTYKGRFGESPLKGTIKGNDIKFSTTINAQGQDLEITYTGTVDGNSMKGKAAFGAMGEGAFSGKKAEGAAPTAAAPAASTAGANVTGSWNFSVETPNGTMSPTAVLKQDGDKLSGTYKGRSGDTPLTGTVTGNDVKFSFKVNRGGQDMEISYAGTVDANSMKGTVKFGDMGEAPFTGKKQD